MRKLAELLPIVKKEFKRQKWHFIRKGEVRGLCLITRDLRCAEVITKEEEKMLDRYVTTSPDVDLPDRMYKWTKKLILGYIRRIKWLNKHIKIQKDRWN